MLKELDLNIEYDKLVTDVELLGINKFLNTNYNQMSVQHRGVTGDIQYKESCNSLFYDWDRYDPSIHTEVPLKREKLSEDTFNITCDIFKDTYTGYVIDLLKTRFNVYRGRYMQLKYKNCLSMHTDETKRLHIPLITNPDAFMVIDNKVYTLPFGKAYIADTTFNHTAINAGKKDRLHLVFCCKD